MKKVVIKKLSLLGLILIAASAVTATIFPSNKKPNTNSFIPNGSITLDDNHSNASCTPTAIVNSGCYNTNSKAGVEGPSGSTRYSRNPSRSDNTTGNDIE
jgi:hypothetical protein